MNWLKGVEPSKRQKQQNKRISQWKKPTTKHYFMLSSSPTAEEWNIDDFALSGLLYVLFHFHAGSCVSAIFATTHINWLVCSRTALWMRARSLFFFFYKTRQGKHKWLANTEILLWQPALVTWCWSNLILMMSAIRSVICSCSHWYWPLPPVSFECIFNWYGVHDGRREHTNIIYCWI